jgi:hypothetical protein
LISTPCTALSIRSALFLLVGARGFEPPTT